MASTTQPAARVVIIYNADGTLRGKVAYAYRKLFPRDDGTTAQPACGNCDITHGGLSLSETPAWRTRKAALEQELGVKIEQRHRDELDSKIRSFAQSNNIRFPTVLYVPAGPDTTPYEIMDRADVNACALAEAPNQDKSPTALQQNRADQLSARIVAAVRERQQRGSSNDSSRL